jgi:hypothetical protein
MTAIFAAALGTGGVTGATLAEAAEPAPVSAGWRLVKTFPQGASFLDFQQVISESKTAAWAVGQKFGGGRPAHAVTAYWSGRSWAAVPLPRGELADVGIVAGSSPTNVWAFGTGRGGNYLLRWAHSHWSVRHATGG